MSFGDGVAIKTTPYFLHTPWPKQQAFLWLDDCFEAMFGGAAGPGKSDALLMAALQYVDVPGYAAILFRKTTTDLSLPGALIPRSQEWLNETDAKWNDNRKRWTFPSGATLSFGYMRTDDDRFRYQSSEFQFIGFDELTQFSRLQYTYMYSRCRRPKEINTDNPLSRVPLRIRSATNPGGRGNLWVKNRFIDRTDDPPEDPTQRVFIRGKIEDNPALDKERYLYALEQMDDATKAQLVDGDWNAREAGSWVIPDHTWIEAVKEKGRELGLDPPEPYGEEISIGIDWGEATQAYVIWPLESGGIYIPPSEVIGRETDPGDVTLDILRQAQKFKHPISDARYDAAGVQSMRTFIKTARAQEDPELQKLLSTKIAFGKHKAETMRYLRLLFKRTAMGSTTRIIGIHPDNEELLRQLNIWEKKSPDDERTTKVDDHGPDALIAGAAPIAAAHREYIETMMDRAKKVQEAA